MARIHIDRKKGARETHEETWPIEKLRLDPQNVRFRHIEKLMSDAEIEDYIWKENDTRDLFRAVIASGGLSEKPFITKDGIVREGNRRVVVLRRARAQLKDGKIPGLPKDTFDTVTVEAFDEGITPEELDLWLARVHVSGKKEWSALNQADHLFRLYNDRGYSYEQIRELLGMGKAEVMRKIDAYNATREYLKESKDKDINNYSFFEEMYKKKEVGKMFDGDMRFRKQVFGWIESGKFDLTGAKDMRKLPEVLNDKDAKKAFEQNGMAAAMYELQKKNPALGSATFKAIDSALTALRTMPRDEVNGLKDNPRQVQLLRDLGKEIEAVLGK